MTGRTSGLVREDEPHWMMCLREYVIPSLVFIAMLYYLIAHVFIPMRRISRSTFQSSEEVLDAHNGGEAASSDGVLATPSSKAKKRV